MRPRCGSGAAFLLKKVWRWWAAARRGESAASPSRSCGLMTTIKEQRLWVRTRSARSGSDRQAWPGATGAWTIRALARPSTVKVDTCGRATRASFAEASWASAAAARTLSYYEARTTTPRIWALRRKSGTSTQTRLRRRVLRR